MLNAVGLKQGETTLTRLLFSCLLLGCVWLVLGLPWVPSGKLYQQGLVVLLWLPALLLCYFARHELKQFFKDAPAGVWVLVALVAWAAMSLFWTDASSVFRESKRIAYVTLFLLAMILVGMRLDSRQVANGLWWVGLGLAAAALASIVSFYVIDGHPWSRRLHSLGRFDYPVIGGFAFAAGFGLLATLWPEGWVRRTVSAVALVALLMAIWLTQTRGAALTVLAFLLAYGLWAKNKRLAWTVAGLVAIASVITYVFFEQYVTARGYSWRPQIMLASIELMLSKPLLGLGIGAPYSFGRDEGFPFTVVHSHSLPLHVGIELGLPGLLLWIALWIAMGLHSWRHRNNQVAQVVLTLTLLAVISSAFDIGRVWTTPRAEWLLVWLPVGLWLSLIAHPMQRAAIDR